MKVDCRRAGPVDVRIENVSTKGIIRRGGAEDLSAVKSQPS